MSLLIKSTPMLKGREADIFLKAMNEREKKAIKKNNDRMIEMVKGIEWLKDANELHFNLRKSINLLG